MDAVSLSGSDQVHVGNGPSIHPYGHICPPEGLRSPLKGLLKPYARPPKGGVLISF